MQKMEVFFDYSCPFCLKGHENLLELMPAYPGIEVVWRPCEAHPRPEEWGLHSDLCIQGMFFARDNGADLMAYHDRMYKACHKDRVNFESIDALVACVSDILDGEAFRKSLESGEYADEVLKANDYAYEQSGVWAVPSYRIKSGEYKKLDAIEGVGVSKDMLAEFMAG